MEFLIEPIEVVDTIVTVDNKAAGICTWKWCDGKNYFT